jgi:hypothetical protein
MTTAAKSETLPGPSMDGPDPALVQAAAVACAYLTKTQQANKASHFKVFFELAEQTVVRARAGKTTEFTAQNLKAGVADHASKEASGWLSPLWAKLIELEPQWQAGLLDTAQELGKTYIPKLGKQPGSPAHYFIQAVALDANDTGEPRAVVPTGWVHYTPEAVAAPAAWLNKALTSGVVPWGRGLNWSIGGMIGIFLIVVSFVVWLMFAVGLKIARPVSPADLSIVSLVLLFVFLVWRVFYFLDKLFTFRIVMAPDVLTPLSATDVTLEVRRPKQEVSQVELAFVRYSATCPVCGGIVEIHEGRRAFPDRLVGRCRRASREHVFSFDPVLRTGYPLRNPGRSPNDSSRNP